MRKAFLLLAARPLAGRLRRSRRAGRRARISIPRDVAEAQHDHPEAGRRSSAAPRPARARPMSIRSAAASPPIRDVPIPQAFRFTVLNSAVENAFAVPGGYVYITRQLMALMDDESAACLRAWPRSRPYRRQSRPGAPVLCPAQHDPRRARRGPRQRRRRQLFGDMLSRRWRQQARAAGDAQLLARPGISGRHARHALSDRRRLRSGRRPRASLPRSAGRARLQARVQGRDQPPDAGMGEHPPAERKPHAARARGGAGDRPARHGHAQPRPVPRVSSKASIVDDDPAQGIIEGRTFTHPDLRIHSPFRRAI